MTFTRTYHGLFNYRIFLDSDVIAFCEGGGNIDFGGDLSTLPPQRCPDMIFWEKRLATTFCGSKMAIRPIGNKKNVISIYNKLKDSSSTAIAFCMDSDFDDLLGQKIQDERVFYTTGYSIENDILSLEKIASFAQRYRPVCSRQEAEDFARIVVDHITNQSGKLGRYVLIDVCLFVSHRRLFIGTSVSRFLDSDDYGAPSLNTATLRSCAISYLNTINRFKFRPCTTRKIHPIKDLCGHALFDLAFAIIVWTYRHHFGSRLLIDKAHLKMQLCDS